MVKLAAITALLVLGVVARADDPASPPVNPTAAEAVRDGPIMVIADDGLYATSDGKWQRQEPERKTPHARPVALGKAPGGEVLCLWDQEKADRYFITRHGKAGEIVAEIDAPSLANPAITGMSNGDIYVTELGPRIFRVAAGEKAATLLHTISPEQCFRLGRPGADAKTWEPVRVIEDGQKRAWIYSSSSSPTNDSATLRGVLVYDGKGLVHHPTLPGLADRPIAVIEPIDGKTFWLATANDSLFRVELRTWKAHPVKVKGGLRAVDRIGKANGIWYFVSTPLSEFNFIEDAPAFTFEMTRYPAALSRLGVRLKIEVEDLDPGDGESNGLERRMVSMPQGVIVTSQSGGPWVVPQDDRPPVHLDWRTGFVLRKTDRVFLTGPATYLAVSFGEGFHSGTFDPLPQPAPSASAFGVNGAQPIVRDSRRTIWALRVGKETLSAWDGHDWKEVAIPLRLRSAGIQPDLAIDERDRLWLIAYGDQEPTAIYDPAAGTWEEHASYGRALEQQLGRVASFRLSGAPVRRPEFSGDGRIAYATIRTAVNYFDGKKWRRYRGDFLGKEAGDGGEHSRPFFNAAKHLCTNRGHATWELDDTGAWHRAAADEGRPSITDELYPRRDTPEPPPNLRNQPHESLVHDDAGRWWFTEKKQLFKATAELALPFFSPGENHPFLDSRRVFAAITDAAGNAWLRTSEYGSDVYVVVLRSPPPETSVEIVNDPAGGRMAMFQATPAGAGAFFSWQVDDGAWSQPAREAKASLRGFPAGEYRLRVRAIDGHLQSDATPAEASFQVTSDPPAPIAPAVGQLLGHDPAAREAAIATLARTPGAALAALRAIRATASEDGRWWIDAAIQEIERKEKAAPPPRSP